MKRINSITGLQKVEVVRCSSVAFFRIRAGVAFCGVTPDKTFTEIPYSSGGELNFGEKPCTVVFNAPTPDNSNTSFLSSLIGVDVICKVTTNSGVYYVGSLRFPGRLQFEHINAATPGEAAGYKVTVKAYDVSLDWVAKERTFVSQPSIPDSGPEEFFPIVLNAGSWVLPNGMHLDSVQEANSVYTYFDTTIDTSEKVLFSNDGNNLVFENKYVFPDYLSHSPYVYYTLPLSFTCKNIALEFDMGLDKSVGYSQDSFFMLRPWSDKSLLPSETQRLGTVIKLVYPVNGTVNRITLRINLNLLYRVEFLKFGYTTIK
jgi:hypothetical protein